MSSVNKVILLGRVGRDPELKQMQSGKAVVNISIATTSKRKTQDGYAEDTQWHRITAYDKLAEIIGQYVRKGSLIYIEGMLKYGKFTDKDGNEKHTTDIIAGQMQMLGGKSEGQGGDGGYERQRPQAKQQQQFDDMDDDIPF